MKLLRIDDTEDIQKIQTLLSDNDIEYLFIEKNNEIAEITSKERILTLENQLKNLEKNYQVLTKRIRGFLKMELPTGKFTLIDRFLEDLCGYPVSFWEQNANFVDKIVHPEFKDYYLEQFELMRNNILPKIMEYKILTKDGETRWWMQLNIGAYNISNELVSISAVIIDNTENKRSQIKYQNLFENVNAGIFRTDLTTGAILDANQKLAETLGFKTVEEMKEKSKAIDYYFHQNERQRILTLLKEKGIVEDMDVQMKTIDGRVIWGSLSAKLFRDEGFIEGIAIDITKRKQAENKLLESEEKFRTIVEQNVAGIVIIKNGKIVFINDIITRHSGYNLEELAAAESKGVLELIHPEDRDYVCKQFEVLAEKGHVPEFYCRLHTKSGKTIWISTQLKSFQYEGVQAISAVIVEVTKRVELQQKLRKERDLATKYFDIAGTMLVVMDTNATVTEINRKGCEILGYAKEEIIGKNWVDSFLPERVKNGVRKTFNKTLQQLIKPDQCFENYVLTKNGEERLISWHNTTLKENDKVTAIISSGEDITEWRQAEKLLQEQNFNNQNNK